MHRIGPFVVGWALPFVLVLYLALRRGGYDAEIWSEVGIILWAVVLIGALAGILPARRLSRQAWIAFGLLGAFCAWTALSLIWTESAERSFDEAARLVMLVGAFALALTTQGKDGVRRTLGGVAAAIAVVAGLALLSRFDPSLFPANEAANETVRARLNYPLNYWNGLATLMAIGLPLLLVFAAEARLTITRVLATASLPLLGLTLFFTFSRGGAIAAAIAIGVFFALHPRRLAALVPVVLGALGTALLIALAEQREPIIDFIPEAIPSFPGDPRDFDPMAAEMIAATVVVFAGVALLRVATLLVERFGMLPRIELRRPPGRVVAGALAAIAIVAVVALDVPGRASDAWADFKDPEVAATSSDRFDTASGNGRYQYWDSSLEAMSENPLTGTGAGTFEYWWDRNGTLSSLVRDAHSLVFETAGELGLVGVLLLVGLVGGILVLGVRRTLAATGPNRALLAAGVAGSSAFAFGMTIDWGWELAVLPVVFLLIAAALLAGDDDETEPRAGTREAPRRMARARPARGPGARGSRRLPDRRPRVTRQSGRLPRERLPIGAFIRAHRWERAAVGRRPGDAGGAGALRDGRGRGGDRDRQESDRAANPRTGRHGRPSRGSDRSRATTP